MVDRIDPQHSSKRSLLRIVGPLLLAVGGLFMAVGLISFFSAFGGFGPPRYAWCCFVAMPFLAVGTVLSKFAFMGAVARYAAGEVAPVAKDTFNYVADEAQEGIQSAAAAIASGLASSSGQGTVTKIRCPKCNEENDVDAKFCSQCGSAIEKTKSCPSCSELNDPDARFCDNCGRAL